jgi:hypothetical protein
LIKCLPYKPEDLSLSTLAWCGGTCL